MYRGRFAPTPSGRLHIGNLYAALMAWLHARSAGGAFALRMEDIDKPRCKSDYAELVLKDLRWFGLDWDEGPDVGGPYVPYTQSERTERYEAALDALLADGRLYPCFCSRAELFSVASAPHGLSSEGPAYGGVCRSLTPEQRTRKAETKTPSLRFAVPPDAPVAFEDGVYGRIEFPPGAGGDFVVRRADGIIGYQLAVVVDDAAMNVTHALRGADLLDSTPRQLWLYEALGLTPPTFAHVPLLCDERGERLSKRQKSLAAAALREAGVPAETLVGLVAWSAGLVDRPEPIRPAELVAGFDLDKLPRDPIRFPLDALRNYGV
ncbi:tRNA glutamyl-Q(34) synthetase GluQRS [Paenibacillus antri]|uniref:Glutamyl-Q tRNA(Asp) synthetase n=1 Tax=Paenibacillus antri TaxID=2582848 RepID=A0A5R9GHN5_9BACL|nr:tRNA glutamyl-Q(34) synthetase GluQRS [Paenibacillus antri]TLS52293.1 tRNA glutamyl-Q(34) synthetase GluQRS [Paenibacillus antri]